MIINHGAIYRRRRRTFAGTSLLVVLVIVIAAVTGGGKLPTGHRSASTPPVSAPRQLVYRSLVRLTTGLSDSAIAPLSQARFVTFGGLASSGGASHAIFTVAAPAHGSAQATLTSGLRTGLSGAVAVRLGGAIYLLGGRDGRTFASGVYRYTPNDGTLTLVGRLPHGRADFGAAVIGKTVYLVGGDGASGSLDTIITWRPGRRSVSRTVGTLPRALSYMAVTAANGRLIILGGLSQGAASSEILAFNPARAASRAVTRLALLPHATTHATAAAIGGTVYMIGGLRDATQVPTAVVYSINAASGKTVRAGLLPQGRWDVAAVLLGRRIALLGGRSKSATLDVVGELVAAPATSSSG